MKYYLIAGEASGDLHAHSLIKGLSKFDKEASFRFFGGDLMEAAGGTLVKHYREMAFMGVKDVAANIRTIKNNLTYCRKDILNWEPDVVIPVDYAGFNLRVAKFAKENNLRVFYYIPPKVWAWKKKRIEKLRAFTDLIFVILPFELDYFRKRNVEAEYYGNPLMDALHTFRKSGFNDVQFRNHEKLNDRPVIALLSGSRRHEIAHCLPEMLKATDHLNDYQRVIAGARSIPYSFYEKFTNGKDVKILHDKTYEILSVSKMAIVTSGTATLETAIFRVPQLVVYKTSPLQYEIGRHFVKIKYFSLVNLIAGREVVKELLQKDLAENIRKETEHILNDNDYYKKMQKDYDEIIEKLGEPGSSERVAARMTEVLKVI